MSGIPDWAQPVQLLEDDQERINRLASPTIETNPEVSIPEWAQPVQLQEDPSVQETPSDIPEWAQPVTPGLSPIGTQDTPPEGLVGLPEGIEAYTYSENDLSERPELYNPIYEYLEDRYGKQAVKGKSRSDVVDTFLNNRRGNAGGNSVRVISETDYLMDAKDDPARLLKAGKAYAIFEGMEGLTGEGVTWGETFEGVKDYTSSAILDPINFVSMGLGKVLGGTTIRAGSKAVETVAQREISKQLVAGATREVALKAGAEVLRKASANAAVQGGAEVAQFATKMAANKGVQRLMTSAGLKEVAATAITDAAINSGTEFLYQRSLVDTNVQGEISKSAVGIAALSAIAMGGVQAGLVVRRGASETALVSETVQRADPKQIAKDLQASIKEWAGSLQDEVGSETDWLTKVKNGEELTDGDTDFFIDLLLGRNDAEGNVQLKGLAQHMQEGGYFYTKRDENDKLSNWLADFMKEELDQSDIDDIMKAVGDAAGTKVNGKVTPEAFGDAFASKMNASARSMNSVMQVAKRLDVSVADLDVDKFFEEAMGLNLIDDIKLSKDRYSGKGTFAANVTETQNKFIRSLVSHPSTSALNVLGYGAAAGLDVSTDITVALFKGTRGTFKSILGYADSGAKELYVAKQLLLASKDRVKFALDPDMTHAAYKSALLQNTGALDKLNRTLSGGVDISNSVEQMSRLGGRAGLVQDKADTVLSHVQSATFVHAQDAFTKSQEYVGQMNKLLRTKFGKSWNEFYTDPNAVKVMATKEYKQLEMDAVSATLANTFSKSYKDNTKLGELAGFIEDARNIPGLGFMVPFGRFFNNTIDFGIKNTPLLNIAAKKSGKYADMGYEDLMARGAVVTGLVWTMAQDEDENRRMGLGLYDKVVDGQVVSQQYDYPISLFKAAARVISYKMAGEDLPAEIITQIGKDFGVGGLTRNLNKTSAEFADFGAAILAGEMEGILGEGQTIVSDISAQALSGFLRPLEPIDTGIAIFAGVDQSPKDTAQGNKLIGDSLRYIDTTANFFLGKGDAPIKQAGATGDLSQQSTKNLGVRTQNMTNTQRVMNMLGLNQWDINSGLSKDKRLMIPEAVNEYQRQVYAAIEGWSTAKMENEAFRNSDSKTQRMFWDDHIEKVTQEAKFMLIVDYDGPQSTLRAQYDIMNKFNIDEVESGLESLEFDKTIGELSEVEISMLRAQLESAKYIDRMNVDVEVYD
jgi:GH24 family phage-related lysozyme (muramidase)